MSDRENSHSLWVRWTRNGDLIHYKCNDWGVDAGGNLFITLHVFGRYHTFVFHDWFEHNSSGQQFSMCALTALQG